MIPLGTVDPTVHLGQDDGEAFRLGPLEIIVKENGAGTRMNLAVAEFRGNAFRIPPRALRFDDAGRPGDNQVGIRSKHLRGGHYVVNSDFRFKFRLTATPVWTIAKSTTVIHQ